MAYSIKEFSIVFQISWKIASIVTQFLVIKSLQIFPHAMTVQLLCHVQNFVEITH